MSYDLVSEADFEQFPTDPFQKFAALEQLCRRNMLEAISHESAMDFDNLVRTQYMTIVAAAAEELGIEGIQYVKNFGSPQANVEEFMRIASGVVARIRLRGTSGKDGLSVRLANRTKGIIENELAKVRDAVANSDLEERKKRRLLDKIEDFRTELHKERFRFGPAMATLAVIAAGVGSTTGFFADAPGAVTTIITLVGQDKEHEDSEVKRLEGPRQPALVTDKTRDPSVKTSRKIDEDIPF